MTAFWAGKKKIGLDIAEAMMDVINTRLDSGETYKCYYEPFVGMAGVMPHVIELCKQHPELAKVRYRASDSNPVLVAFWDAIINKNWKPPNQMSRADYLRIKATWKEPNKKLLHLYAFCGFSLGFHGQYFFGNPKQDRIDELLARNCRAVAKIAPKMKNVKVKLQDFFKLPFNRFKNYIFYLDGPYKQTRNNRTSKTASESSFDHDLFWHRAEELSQNNLVFVSEVKAPAGWLPVWQKTWKHFANGNAYKRAERLFLHQPQVVTIKNHLTQNKKMRRSHRTKK
jgi:DNA adenine methylase